MIEIERKFLVTSEDYKKEANVKKRIVQGFLNSHPNRTVRVRIKADKGFLTVKGKSSANGTMRFEWEREIPLSEAESLLRLCEEGVISKVRYEVVCGAHTFEVDEFHGENEGLIVAEVELKNEDESFERPGWLGEEVTGQIKYYNSQLSKKPFNKWNE
ncbi:CYTH domain-containing protein [Zhouia amylolytica]|uniref:CYTH domain-containing protein n=1 Tax=Zhouia amylolytica TaxID=376730 RepID=A0A1I6SED5_9FLAO|nr:CYTH domain-containing protein [Zhouia amylolytica]SFS75307.1 CYTH domain-containing protein [Zhouia amylolytica]